MSIFDGSDRNGWLLLMAVAMLFSPARKDETKAQYVQLFWLFVVPVVLAISIWHLKSLEKVRLIDLATMTLLYGAWLFLMLSQILQWGLALQLTKWRGEKWPKEIDYVYILFAVAGLLLTINRLDFVEDRLVISDVLGPLFIITALAIRALKTRAEIAEWNK